MLTDDSPLTLCTAQMACDIGFPKNRERSACLTLGEIIEKSRHFQCVIDLTGAGVIQGRRISLCPPVRSGRLR